MRPASLLGGIFVFPMLLVMACGAGASPAARERSTSTPCTVTGETGTSTGAIIPAVEVQRCDGTVVTFHELVCGEEVTLIDVGAAAYPACIKATELYADDPGYDALQADGLNIVQIFALDRNLLRPTSQFCEDYTRRYAIDFHFLIDPDGESDFLSPFLPLNFVVGGDGRILRRWSPTIPDAKPEILRSMLARP